MLSHEVWCFIYDGRLLLLSKQTNPRPNALAFLCSNCHRVSNTPLNLHANLRRGAARLGVNFCPGNLSFQKSNALCFGESQLSFCVNCEWFINTQQCGGEELKITANLSSQLWRVFFIANASTGENCDKSFHFLARSIFRLTIIRGRKRRQRWKVKQIHNENQGVVWILDVTVITPKKWMYNFTWWVFSAGTFECYYKTKSKITTVFRQSLFSLSLSIVFRFRRKRHRKAQLLASIWHPSKATGGF